MRFFGTNGFAAFQPPSDMGGAGGGEGRGKKKILVGLGIGCGVILLVIGLLFAAGAFKAVSCCSDVANLAQSSVGARDYGQKFADAVAQGKLDEAYAMTSPEFQAKTSREAFGNAIAAHREKIASNAPRMFNLELQTKGDPDSLESLKSGAWNLSYQFAGPADETMLLLNVLVTKPADAVDDATAFTVEGVQLDERPRNLAAEPPAEEVLKIHDLLQRGSYEMAYSRLAPRFQESSDFETFRKFLDDTGDILQRSDLAIREITYNETNTQATVMAQATTADGANAIVQYELVPLQPDMPGFGWRVVAIAPIIGAKPSAPAPDAGAAAAAATNNAAEVEAPQVDVEP